MAKKPSSKHPALLKEQMTGMRLEGRTVRLAGQVKESDVVKLALLAEHVQRLRYPNYSPFQSSLTRFRTGMVYTRDEARGGRVAPIPDLPHLREVDEALITESHLFIEKSRRMLLTWTVLAWDLWIAAGGQDPRWPTLMEAKGNRKVILAARKLEGENGSADFLSRIRFIYDQIEERGLREQWPDFPTAKWRFDQAVFSNGSLISAVAQGEHQLAGAGVTALHFEETARWEEQQRSISTGLQTLTGGGHVVIVTTAQANTYCAKLALDQINPAGSIQ